MFKSLFMKLGVIFVNLKLTCVDSIHGINNYLAIFIKGFNDRHEEINDLFLLTLMLPRIVIVACVGHVLVAPCVGFVLGFIGVVKSKSLPIFINVGQRRGLLGPKDYEKLSRLIVLFGFMPWLN